MTDVRTAIFEACDGATALAAMDVYTGRATPDAGLPHAVISDLEGSPTDKTFGTTRVERPRITINVYELGLDASSDWGTEFQGVLDGAAFDLGGGERACLNLLIAPQTTFDSSDGTGRDVYRTILIFEVLLNRN